MPIAASKDVEGGRIGQLYAGGEAVRETGIAGVGKAEVDLIEGADGELRAKR